MNSFLFFLSFILLNPWVLCFLSQALIPGKVGGSDFFYFLSLRLSFFRLSPVINNTPASRSVHFVSLFAPVLESFQPIFMSFAHNFRLPRFSVLKKKQK